MTDKYSTGLCIGCRSTQVKRKKNDETSHYCAGCKQKILGIKARTKQEEEKLKKFLRSTPAWGNWSYHGVKLPCATTCRLVDFLYVLEMYAILLEDDENMHMSYNLDCEVTRLHEIADHVKKPLHVIRFNPHRSNFTELSDALTEAFKTNHPIKSDYGICIQYLGYTDSRIYALELAEIELQQAAFDKILDDEQEEEKEN